MDFFRLTDFHELEVAVGRCWLGGQRGSLIGPAPPVDQRKNDAARLAVDACSIRPLSGRSEGRFGGGLQTLSPF